MILGDGSIGFADFLLFMHGQHPTVAQKRGVRGPTAINVALANQHLQGPTAKVGDSTTAGGDGYTSRPPSSPLGTSTESPSSRLPARSKSSPGAPPGGAGAWGNDNILLFNDRAQVSDFTSPAHLRPLSGCGFRHDNGLGFGGSGSLAAAAALAAALPPQPKRHVRVKRGEFAGFDRYRRPRVAADSPHCQTSGRQRLHLTGHSHVGAATARLGTGVLPASTAASGASGAALSVASKHTVNGLRVPCASHPYRGDAVRRLAETSASRTAAAASQRLLTYVADAYAQQDWVRANRVAGEQLRRAARDECGRAVRGRAVLWRTDAGEASAGPNEALVPSGPGYWDPSREHLHLLAFAPAPPQLGRPKTSACSSAHVSRRGEALGLRAGGSSCSSGRRLMDEGPATAAGAVDAWGAAGAASRPGSPQSPMQSPQWPAPQPQPQHSPPGAAEGE